MSQLHELYRLTQHAAAQRARLDAEEARASKWQKDTNRGILLMMAVVCIPVLIAAMAWVAFGN